MRCGSSAAASQAASRAKVDGQELTAAGPEAGPGALSETDAHAQAETWPRAEVELSRGAPVLARSGPPVGFVAALLVSGPENRATHLLLTPAPPTGEYRLVPCDLVLRVEAGRVHLTCSTEAIAALEVFEAPPGPDPAHAR